MITKTNIIKENIAEKISEENKIFIKDRIIPKHRTIVKNYTPLAESMEMKYSCIK